MIGAGMIVGCTLGGAVVLGIALMIPGNQAGVILVLTSAAGSILGCMAGVGFGHALKEDA